MFGWDFNAAKRRRNVKAMLTKRVNTRVMEERLNANECRESGRISYLDPLVLVPEEDAQWDFESAFVAITHDLSSTGLSLCHTAKMEGVYLVELRAEGGSHFFSATTRHCTSLGFGFWLIGLQAEESLELNRVENQQFVEAFERLHGPVTRVD